MSIDDRLSAGLAANADNFQPPVETQLAVVRSRGRKHLLVRRTAWSVVAAAIAAGLLVAQVGSGWWPTGREVPPANEGGPVGVLGRYRAEVTQPTELAGTWTLWLRGNGTAKVTAPPSYGGVTSGTLYHATDASLRITLFTQDVCADLPDGVYTWLRRGDELVLSGTRDPCEARRLFFTHTTWRSVP